MKINSITNIHKQNFRGYGGSTENVKANNTNVLSECIHESHFMRNLESLEFSTEYITKNFPNGTHIADFGCSNGEETYSIAALLHKSNQDKKYKITGFDIIPSVIEDAKIGVINVGSKYWKHGKLIEDKYEKFLIDGFTKLTPEQTMAKDAFSDCFEEIPAEWKYFNVSHPRYKNKIKDSKYIKLKPNQDIELVTKRIEALYLGNPRRLYGIKNFIPKDGVFDNVIKFKVGDAGKLDEFLKPKSTGAFVFKNSLYHILGSRPSTKAMTISYANVDVTPANILFKKLHKLLQKDGIFVLGNLGHDHLCDYYTKPSGQILQKGNLINVYNTSKIHQALYQAGFEPIFYECMKTGGEDFINLDTYLPSVWKKVEKKSLISGLVTTLKSSLKSTAKLF